jgi:hypothetical protein
MKKIESRKRGSPLPGLLIILASFVAGGYFYFQNANAIQKQKIVYLEKLSEKLRAETVPIKFMILSRSEGQIKARIKLYDLAGSEVAIVEKSWPGTMLYIDMLLVPARSAPEDSAKGSSPPAADSWLAFPYRIFTDEVSASAGTLLFDAYDSGGFPQVFRGLDWTAGESKAIADAYAAARKSAAAGLPATDSAKGSFGSAAHEVSKISSFDIGLVYKVVCRLKGGIEIMEE